MNVCSGTALSFMDKKLYKEVIEEAKKAYDVVVNKTGKGNEFLGWVNLPNDYDKDEFDRIKKTAEKIKSNSDVLLVIGIGGSYLGAKAAIEGLSRYFNRDGIEIIFVGNSMSSTYIQDLIDYLENKDFSINIISKSGTTTEPAIAFRIFRDLLKKKYKNYKSRIYSTTDKSKGSLHELSIQEGYEMFTVPDDVGGRFSVLTAVGLLPIACAGISIDDLMRGAQNAITYCKDNVIEYASVRNTLYRQGFKIEILEAYEPSLRYFTEWWKQLFGESEGKDKKGIFPSAAIFSTDLHSMGQYIQDGERIVFETVINVLRPRKDLIIEGNENDGLNYLVGKSIDYVNKMASKGTTVAHNNGGVPNIVIEVDTLSAYDFGYLIYFFEMSCAVSAYILGVNPFNQPGVEEYKKNMFELLEKPGYKKEV